MNPFFSALAFLTILPAPVSAHEKPQPESILWYPVIGLLIGGFLCGVDITAVRFLHPQLAALASVLFLTLITGALHLDGLADTADGMFSHQTRKRTLEIMRDSRIGVMGATALFFGLMLKTAGVLGIQGGAAWVWLMAAPAMARCGLALGLVTCNYARSKDEGLGSGMFQKGRYRLLALCPLALAVPFLDGLLPGVTALSVFAVVSAAMFAWFEKRLGGMTGDTLGAVAEVLETGILIVGGFFPHFPLP